MFFTRGEGSERLSSYKSASETFGQFSSSPRPWCGALSAGEFCSCRLARRGLGVGSEADGHADMPASVVFDVVDFGQLEAVISAHAEVFGEGVAKTRAHA